MDRGSLRQAFRWALSGSPALLLPLLSLLLYFPALHHGFVMDDTVLVVGNPYIKSWEYLPQLLMEDVWNVWERHNYWRPVLSLSLALDYSLWGLNPFGFHLTNILLHALNAVLLYSLGKRLQNTTCALFASLLFALHPIQTHAVNVISIRGDLLAAVFTLLCVEAFFSKRLVLGLFLLLLALLSKETSMVLPAALLIGVVLVEQERPGWKICFAFVVLALYLLVRLSLGFSFSLPESIFSYHTTLEGRVLLAFKVLSNYFLSLVNLFDLPHPFWSVEVPISVLDPYVLGGLMISGLFLATIWMGLRKRPLIAFGLSWFLIYFAPISNLKELNQPMAEHWLYIPMIGLSLTFGSALQSFLAGLREFPLVRSGIRAGVATFFVLAALVAGEKTKLYSDDESFLLAAIRANPQTAKLYSILGSTYLARQDIPRAEESYAKALALDPNDLLANYRTGFLLFREGQYERAKNYLERVGQGNPTRLAEILMVAHVWEMLGDKERARFYYRKALDLNPASARIQGKLADLEKTAPHLFR